MHLNLLRRGNFSSVRELYYEARLTSISLPLCLAVIGILTREIAVQVRDRNLHITNRHNDNEARR